MIRESLPDQSVAVAFHLKCPVPACVNSKANVFVRSASIVTFRCTTCRFTWSARIVDLPPSLRQDLDALPLL
jgi:transposase-like protein